MKNIFISLFAALTILSGSVELVKAQDSIKTVVKRTAVKPQAARPVSVDPVTGKPVVPINPKTRRPYSRYGYYSKYRYNAKAAHTADSLKKAAALKAPASPAIAAQPDSIAAATQPTDKSLNGQYQYLLSKIYNYQRPLAAALWKNVLDSLSAGHRKLTDAQAKAAEQSKTISSLQADAAAKNDSVLKADEINLLGISTSKSTYNLIMWGLVIAFGLAAVIVIARSGSLKHEAAHRTSLYNELEEEYKAFKTKANEKEKKLARELQTERNKIDELMGRG